MRVLNQKKIVLYNNIAMKERDRGDMQKLTTTLSLSNFLLNKKAHSIN